ncbi:MAG: dienelactone hydrolase family protein [Dehalococcoidia bacterium]
MADINTDIVAFPVTGGQCAGYLAKPPVSVNAPGVVVVHEWWGLTEHIKDITQRLAADGFVALAPDLYRGTVTDNAANAAALMQEMDMSNAVEDVLGAIRYLQDAGSPAVGIAGFCMGGKITIQAAIEGEDSISAAVPFYGFNPDPVSEAGKITAPVLAFYGTDDPMVSPSDAEAFEAVLQKAGRAVETHMYPDATHGFFNDTRPDAYNPDAAKDAWERTLAFLRKHLT